MALVFETAAKDAIADAIDTYVNGGTAPELVFETSGDVECATIILNATNAFGASSGGIITLADTPLSDTNATGGTVAQFSIYQNVSQGAEKVVEGTVLTSGGDINLTTLAVAATETVTLTSFTITVP